MLENKKPIAIILIAICLVVISVNLPAKAAPYKVGSATNGSLASSPKPTTNPRFANIAAITLYDLPLDFSLTQKTEIQNTLAAATKESAEKSYQAYYVKNSLINAPTLRYLRLDIPSLMRTYTITVATNGFVEATCAPPAYQSNTGWTCPAVSNTGGD